MSNRTVYLDTETTGLEANRDRVLEVAAIAFGAGSLTREPDTFHELINPGRSITPDATRIHSITNDKVADKPAFGAIAQSLANFIRGANVVIHNASFDCDFLDNEFMRIGMKETIASLAAKIIDTLALARRKFPGQRVSLDALCQRFGIDVARRRPVHGALIDVELLCEVHRFLTSGQITLQLIVANKSLTQIDNGPEPVLPIAPSPAREKEHQDYIRNMLARSRANS